MKKDKEWLKNEVKSLFDEAYDSGKMEYYESEESIHRINNLVDQLDEQEVPVIPKFVADYIERAKSRHDSIYQAMKERASEEVNKWIQAFYNSDKFARAWLDGYTIEKEPQWVVKDDTGYLSYLQFSIPDIYELETSPDKNDAYKFNSKSKADLIADLVNGTAEEVTE